MKMDGDGWFYGEKVKDHFFIPKNLIKTQEEAKELMKTADGVGVEGSPACVVGKTKIHTNPNQKEKPVAALSERHPQT